MSEHGGKQPLRRRPCLNVSCTFQDLGGGIGEVEQRLELLLHGVVLLEPKGNKLILLLSVQLSSCANKPAGTHSR